MINDVIARSAASAEIMAPEYRALLFLFVCLSVSLSLCGNIPMTDLREGKPLGAKNWMRVGDIWSNCCESTNGIQIRPHIGLVPLYSRMLDM